MGQVNEAGDLLAASVWPHHLVSTIKSGGKESWIYFSYRNLQPYEYSSINQVGYVLRMDQACIPKVVQRLTLDKRKSGRLKTTWSRTVMAELSEGHSHGARHNMLPKMRLNGERLLLLYVPQGTKTNE